MGDAIDRLLDSLDDINTVSDLESFSKKYEGDSNATFASFTHDYVLNACTRMGKETPVDETKKEEEKKEDPVVSVNGSEYVMVVDYDVLIDLYFGDTPIYKHLLKIPKGSTIHLHYHHYTEMFIVAYHLMSGLVKFMRLRGIEVTLVTSGPVGLTTGSIADIVSEQGKYPERVKINKEFAYLNLVGSGYDLTAIAPRVHEMLEEIYEASIRGMSYTGIATEDEIRKIMEEPNKPYDI